MHRFVMVCVSIHVQAWCLVEWADVWWTFWWGHRIKFQPPFVFSAVSCRNAFSVSCCRVLTFVSEQHLEFYLFLTVYLDYVNNARGANAIINPVLIQWKPLGLIRSKTFFTDIWYYALVYCKYRGADKSLAVYNILILNNIVQYLLKSTSHMFRPICSYHQGDYRCMRAAALMHL
jgi:hypothetical protein